MVSPISKYSLSGRMSHTTTLTHKDCYHHLYKEQINIQISTLVTLHVLDLILELHTLHVKAWQDASTREQEMFHVTYYFQGLHSSIMYSTCATVLQLDIFPTFE